MTAALRPRLSVRLAPAPRVATALVGRTPEQALALIGAVYMLCVHAHTQAAAEAFAQPGGLALQHGVELAAATRAEAVREHGVRMLLDWPGLVAEPPDRSAAAHWVRARGDERRACVERFLLGAPADRWLEDGPVAWSARGATVAARVVARMIAFGAGGIEGGQEVSPHVRHRHRPEVAALPPLAARFLARIVDLLDLLHDQGPPAEVWTARGRLTHRCLLADGRITAYAITTPTDIHFGPDGVATRALQHAADGPPVLAEAIVRAFDPCLPFTIEVA
ncbi:MAG: hypothetical protein J0H67_14975 [Rhodospirillales bacterium]|nr:hypothetical protein [Rhodospirillales bacterium]